MIESLPMAPYKRSPHISAFTLIELSIVLVIIGLLVGAVFVGHQLRTAARVRSLISQVDQYKTAINTFKLKYGYLPGDIPDPTASGFGFAARGSYAGQGDGNGIIEGNVNQLSTGNRGYTFRSGETLTIWRDLTASQLVSGSFTLASSTSNISTITASTSPSIDDYFPKASIGNGNYLVAWSTATSRQNYLSVQAIIDVGSQGSGTMKAFAGLTVNQAYSIDSKLDDGIPQTGQILARYTSNNSIDGWYPAGVTSGGTIGYGATSTAHTPGSSSTCYDNNDVQNATHQYSLSQNGGEGINCALSFPF